MRWALFRSPASIESGDPEGSGRWIMPGTSYSYRRALDMNMHKMGRCDGADANIFGLDWEESPDCFTRHEYIQIS